MGAGKTEVGKVLAAKLKKEFIELDALISDKAGKSIPRIFQEDGEIAFREIEIVVTKEVAASKNLVIACGGGIALNKMNIDRLKLNSRIVYLTAAPKAILKRVSDNEERPLLNTQDKVLQIKELLAFRKPFYERAADIKINTSRLNINSVIGQIIERLKEDEGFCF